MLDPVQKTILYDQNAIYFGFPIQRLMERAGKGIADVIIKKYPRATKTAFFCGPGNNGGDGFVAARYLKKKSKDRIVSSVFLIPDQKKINTPESQKNWELFKGKKQDNVSTNDIPDEFEIVIDCLFGTGITGEIREPYASIIKKINLLHGKKITIDLPTPGFDAEFSISMMFPKMKHAAVVDIGYPTWLEEKIGIGEVKILSKPQADSKKGDNGKLLIIGGSKKFHGAPLFAAKIASRIVDLVYFSSVPENNELVKHMKSNLCDFISVPQSKALQVAKKVDTILIGPGLEVNSATKKLTNEVLLTYPRTPSVLDAGALRVLDLKHVHRACILTPHKQEFQKLFGRRATKKNVQRMAQKHQCVIVLKGKEDFVADATHLKINTTGNAGMTKGGTGDVLAGLIAGLATSNDVFLSASAGVFLNGLAGNRLLKNVSTFYNASDLANEIPKTMKWCYDQ